MNDSNLKPVKTTEEAKKRGAAGGKKSGETKRAQKRFLTLFQKILSTKIDITGDLAKEIRRINPEVPADEAIVMAIIYKAANGDVAAFKEIRDTIGEKPKDKVEHTGTVTIEQHLKGVKRNEY